jgi:hypothetical protein
MPHDIFSAFPALPAAIIFLFGFIVTYLARRELLLAWSSLRWPSVTGHVLEKRTKQGLCVGFTTDGTGAPTTRRWKELEIVYAYTVAGENYSSTQIDFSGFGLAGNTHYYEDNEPVTVFYCPGDPSIAVLRPGFRLTMLFGPGLILSGICLGFYMQ